MLEGIEHGLNQRVAQRLDCGEHCAAVAAILRETDGDLHILLIQRSEREGDPWSGHLGFPGGGVEFEDQGLREAAVRETREELGIDLSAARFLGQLDDLRGATIPIAVSGFVFGVDVEPSIRKNDEVADTFWVSFNDLSDPGRQATGTFLIGDELRDHPAIDLRLPGKPLLWGLTYRFIQQFLALAP